MAIAAHLTENRDIRVLVIESGFDESNHGPIIEDINNFDQTFDTSFDHAFETVTLGANKRIERIHAGNGSRWFIAYQRW